MPAKQLQAERELATAIGWTNLVDAGGTLVGTPPGGAEHSRGQAPVPAWTRSWSVGGPLISALGLCVDAQLIDGHVMVIFGFGLAEYVLVAKSEWPDTTDAILYAITTAATAKVTQANSFANANQEAAA